MSRLVLGVIIAVMTVITSLEGLPIENPTSYKDQAVEVQETHQDDANQQRLASIKVVRSAGDEVEQVTTGATDVEEVETCTGILSREQVQDIQLQQTNQSYAIVNGQLIAMDNDLDLYVRMHEIVTRASSRVTDVWLSRAPCPNCIIFIEQIFGLFPVKPVLHVETLNFKGSNYEVIRELGCLARLKGTKFQLKAWRWDVFGEKYGGSCDYHSTPRQNTDYRTRKTYTKTLVDHVGGSSITSSLIKLCHV